MFYHPTKFRYLCGHKIANESDMKYERKIPIDLGCGVSIYQIMAGGKWKPYLINCMNRGLRRPSQFLRVIPGVSKRVLAQQLSEMERMGIVVRTVYPETPPCTEYELSETGRSIIPIIRMMDEWGLKHNNLFDEMGKYKEPDR